MSLFHPSRCPAQSKALHAAFAQNIEAQRRAGKAAQVVTQASDDSRQAVEREIPHIKARIAHRLQARPEPPTSDVRALMDEVLMRPGIRGLPPNRDPS